ncbi:unnamed protein product [Ixodes pacificus]
MFYIVSNRHFDDTLSALATCSTENKPSLGQKLTGTRPESASISGVRYSPTAAQGLRRKPDHNYEFDSASQRTKDEGGSGCKRLRTTHRGQRHAKMSSDICIYTESEDSEDSLVSHKATGRTTLQFKERKLGTLASEIRMRTQNSQLWRGTD